MLAPQVSALTEQSSACAPTGVINLALGLALAMQHMSTRTAALRDQALPKLLLYGLRQPVTA